MRDFLYGVALAAALYFVAMLSITRTVLTACG